MKLKIKKVLLQNHQELETQVELLITFAKKFFAQTQLNKDEKETIVEGLLLKSCAFWESFLEKEIIYLVSLDINKLILEAELPQGTKLNNRLIRAILFSTSYKDLHDITRSMSIFKKYIEDKYNLFNGLPKDLIKKIDLIYKLRNKIVHNSEFSKRQLMKIYNEHLLYKNYLEPGKYLMKDKGKTFLYLIHNFTLISATMRGKLK